MPSRQDETGRWRFRKMVDLPDGTRTRISGSAPKNQNTKRACERAERLRIQEVMKPYEEEKEVPTFTEWFEGRFWREWVIARRNKPSERESKECSFRVHLKEAFGHMRLDEIGVGEIARFRADLVEKGLNDKTINKILGHLSKPLRYAEDVEVIVKAPKVGIFKVERAEIESWSAEQYARMLEAAKAESEFWYAAVCLCGEAGLRVGEVKALDWRRDIDLIAGTLTVNKQRRRDITGTPKGRTRRTIPMTETLVEALKQMDVVRTGYVFRNQEGEPMTDNEAKYHCYRLCRLAGLPEKGWHMLRHTFGTHAAMFGANPWKLMQWMGHKRVDETMLYVHVAGIHLRPHPEPVLEAQRGHDDPDLKVLAMLSARRHCLPVRGKNVAKNGESHLPKIEKA